MSEEVPQAVEVIAIVAKVTTLADNGVRVWLDLDENAMLPGDRLAAAGYLMASQLAETPLRVTLAPEGYTGDIERLATDRPESGRRTGLNY